MSVATTIEVQEKIEGLLTTLAEQEKTQKKLYNTISNLRLLVFLVGVGVGGFYYHAQRLQDSYIGLLVTLLLFVFLVKKHGKIGKNLQQTRYKIIVNQQYLARISGKWITFQDNGQEFVDDQHPYTGDLDIFGPKSLFQWLNIAHTFYGRNLVKKYLSSPDKELSAIQKRQGGVAELAGQLDFCQNIQCAGMSFPKVGHDPEKLLAYAENLQRIISNPWIIRGCSVLPIVTIGSLILWNIDLWIPVYIPMALFILQMLLTLIGYSKIAPVLDEINKIKEDISVFSSLLKLMEEQPLTDEYLRELQSNLRSKEKSSFQEIQKLETIIEFIDVRYSSILYFVLNVCLLWDYHCLFQVENWKRSNGKEIRSWIETIATFEALASLGMVGQINPQWSFPNFALGELKVVAEDMGHPLIIASKRVCNQVAINSELGIITGSNMSGKTTLLRTVGINLVLAYAGAFVCAQKMECTIVDIFTSMRIADDVNSGISTFYAELLRIKMIVDYSHQEKAMIFLIDEIFRGTNSRDRIIGARNVIKNLHKSWIIGLISTHDLELCDLEYEKNSPIKNYHFEESFTAEAMKFDYQLRQGRSTTTNAQYLMKMVGIQLVE